MAGSLLNLGAFLGSNGDPSQFNVSAAVSTLTGGSPLFDPGALGKYAVLSGAPPSIPYTSGIAKFGTRVYQLVKLDAASGSTFGNAVVWKDYSDYIVTTVSSNTKQNDAAGVIVTGSITAAGTVTSLTHDAVNGNYVFIGIDGIFPCVNEAAVAAAAGRLGYLGATTAGAFETTAGQFYVTAATALVVSTNLSAKAALFAGITTTGAYLHANFRFPKLASF
jgi:hypothetical protein